MNRRAADVRCPRCKRAAVTHLLEIWGSVSGEIPFELDRKNGVLTALDHDSPQPHPVGVEAECECGHRWKLRGVGQITEFLEIRIVES